MKIRKEIQGLRGLAVAAVVLFHAQLPFLPGGFLGVDVFFVISGFLITSIILAERARMEFSFRHFYARRAIRLIPALSATIFYTFILAYFLYPPSQVFELAKSALAALFFVSNIFFWNQVSYFDPEAQLKPLLHTWSLGVEEQFYLIWPLAIIAIWKRGGSRGLASFLIVASVLSIAASYAFVGSDPSAVFYLTPFRIAEFSIGALLALPQMSADLQPSTRNLLTGTGVVAILFAVTFFSEEWAVNPISYLVPCLGAALIIVAGNSSLARQLLANRALTWLGAISYSLYLVHWPVIVFLPRGGGLAIGALSVALSILAAAALHYTVESPILARGKETAKARGALLLTVSLGTALVVAPALFGLASKGFAFRLPDGLPPIPLAGEMWEERHDLVRVGKCFLMPDQHFAEFDQEACVSPDPSRKNVLVVGDSYAADFYAAAREAYPDVNFLQATAGNCTPVRSRARDANCSAMVDLAFDTLATGKLDAVVLAGNWGRYPDDLDQMADTVTFLQSLGQRVVVVAPPLRFSRAVPALIFEARSGSVSEVTAYVFARRHRFDRVNPELEDRAETLGATFVRTGDIMCERDCRLFDANDKLLFIDFGHLSKAGLALLSERLQIHYPDLFSK